MLNGSSHLPPELGQGRNWHLTATAESRGCRGFVGPVPQPLWIKESVFSCPAGLYQTASTCRATLNLAINYPITQIPDYPMSRAYAEHSPSMTTGANSPDSAEVDVVLRRRVLGAELLERRAAPA